MQGTCSAKGTWVVTQVEAQTLSQQADRASRVQSRKWKSGLAVWSWVVRFWVGLKQVVSGSMGHTRV